MNYNEFVNTYRGKATDYDGGYGVQCVDLIKLYLDKVFGLKIGAIGNAEAYYRRYSEISVLKNNFTRIANTASFVPKKGDIVIWGQKHSKTGHIAIATGAGTTSWFNSYDQNWGSKEMKLVRHSYKGIDGVLRPKLQYQAHVQDIGWQSILSNGQTAGTTGQSKRVEAIKITSPNIQYRVHMADIGWGAWSTSGSIAGTTGQSRRIEAIEIKSNIPLKAKAHVQDIGWQKEVSGYNIMIGTIGQSKRLEAFTIDFA